MNKKLVISALVAAAFVSSAGAQPLNLGASPTLKRIAETKTIVMAVRDTAPPFSYNNGNDQYYGYSVQICEDIIRSLRLDLKLPSLKVIYLPITGEERIEIITQDHADMECGSTSSTVDRLKKINFSNAFFHTKNYLVGPKGKHVTSFEDIRDMKIAVGTATTHEAMIKGEDKKLNLNLKIAGYKNVPEAFLSVLNGQADFIASNDLLLQELMANTPGAKDKLQIYENFSFYPVTYNIELPKSDPEFMRVVNNYLNALFASDKINQIYNKWFMNPIPPKNKNLNWPMTPETKKLFTSPSSEPLM